jgi:hypothetical protein
MKSYYFSALQEAIETLVVRIVEEKVEPLVAAAVSPPDPMSFPNPVEYLQVLDAYLSMLPSAKDILADFTGVVEQQLPVKVNAQQSLEGLQTIFQVRPYSHRLADLDTCLCFGFCRTA